MKKTVLAALLIVLIWQLVDKKPTWFLRSLTIFPIINTSVIIDFDNIPEGISEQQLVENYSHLLLSCNSEPSNLGDRVCFAYISDFNGIDAKIISFFFEDNQFRYLRISFPEEKHDALLAYLNKGFKLSGNTRGSKEMFGKPLTVWKSKKGLLAALSKALKQHEETLLTWLSFNKVKRH